LCSAPQPFAHELAYDFGCNDESNPNSESMAEGAA